MGSSVRSFAYTAHSFTCSALLTLLAHFAALSHLLTRILTHFRAHRKENNYIAIFAVFFLDHSAPVRFSRRRGEREREKCRHHDDSPMLTEKIEPFGNAFFNNRPKWWNKEKKKEREEWKEKKMKENRWGKGKEKTG